MIDNIDIWVDGIPEGWSLVKLKHVVTKLSRPTSNSDEVLVCTNKGQVSPRGENSSGLISLTENGYQGVQPGDLLIHGMDTWHGAIAVSNLAGKCTSVVHVCDSIEEKRFISYYLRALSFRGVYKAFSNGVRQNTSDFRSWSKIGVIPVIIPSLEEQRRIADFLDDKCAEIDKAIASAEASIEEYKACQQAILASAVLRGLNPDVKQKDSCLDWVGAIPAHWDVVEQKWLMRKVKNICEHYQGENVLSLTTNGVIVRDVASGKGKFPATFDGYQYIAEGNLILCLFDIDVTPRCVGLAKINGVISPAYCQFEMRDGADARFYDYYLRAIDDRKLYLGLTSTLRHSFTADTFGKICAVKPPLDEQRQIVCYLDAKCAEIAKVIEAKQSIIDDLKAYKQSLIYETVTGKRKV